MPIDKKIQNKVRGVVYGSPVGYNMPIDKKIQNKVRVLRTNLNNKIKNKSNTPDEKVFGDTVEDLYSAYRHENMRADKAEGQVYEFKKDLLKKGDTLDFEFIERGMKIQYLNTQLEEVKAEYEQKLAVMQPVSATAELQVAVQEKTRLFNLAMEVLDKAPHDRYCHTQTVNASTCTCWKTKIKEIK
jgi:hypothetical protein